MSYVVVIIALLSSLGNFAHGHPGDAGPTVESHGKVRTTTPKPGVGYTQYDIVSAGGALGALGGVGYAFWFGTIIPGGFIVMPITAAVGAAMVGGGALLWCALNESAPSHLYEHCSPWSSRYRGLDWGRGLTLASAPECSPDRILTHLKASSGRAERWEFLVDQGRLSQIIMTDESKPALNSRVSIHLKVQGLKLTDGVSNQDDRVQARLKPAQLNGLRGLVYEAAVRQVQCNLKFEQIRTNDRVSVRTEPLFELHSEALR